MMTPHASTHASTIRHSLIALAITAAFPLQAMAQDSVPAPAADLHPGNAFIPAANHLPGAKPEAERLVAVA